ncbi:MAG: hypothetical protein DMG07_01475 [Acidobacteria bacterium]|nr:MAG: hypothetical protein DMG07_01475 [Acidobacteriota bacterium]
MLSRRSTKSESGMRRSASRAGPPSPADERAIWPSTCAIQGLPNTVWITPARSIIRMRSLLLSQT